MKIVALVSGGKDSCYAMMECVRYGHEIVCLAHLHPPSHLTADEQEIDSFMYQSVGHNVVQMIAQSMEKPLVTETISGKALKTEIDYITTTEGDEVEDLHRLLEKVKAQYPEVEGVCTGAIFSSYQRNRVENVCSRLGLTSLGYLWRRNQEELLGEMVEAGVEAILVKVAAIGLHPRKHLGRTIGDLQMDLLALQEKYQLNVCGEGGEYETFTLDCPLFTKRIVIDASRVVLHSDDYFAPVAFMVIEQCHLEDKESIDRDALLPHKSLFAPYLPQQNQNQNQNIPSPTTALAFSSDNTVVVPSIKTFRNQVFLSGIISSQSCSQTLEQEMEAVFTQAIGALAQHGLTLDDACFVHLYVRDMADFARLNAQYCKYFSQHMPPSRSCVELSSLPARVLMDCFAVKGSGVAKRETPRGPMRDVMHIKSVSSWAPNCIGPYSQANILHKSLILLAGQVAFRPQTMQLMGVNHTEQTQQVMRNAGNVLEALDSNLRHVCSAVVYVTASDTTPDAVQVETRRLLLTNGGLCDTFENAYNSDESDDECDKNEELVALVRHAPLLCVQLSQLPRQALVEAELQALTHAVVKSLRPVAATATPFESDDWQIQAQYSTIRHRLCHVICTASHLLPGGPLQSAVRGLLLAVENALHVAQLPWDHLCHLRVFYVPTAATTSESNVANAIHDVLGTAMPALTFVAVEAIQDNAQIALQATVQDLDKLETDLWVRNQV